MPDSKNELVDMMQFDYVKACEEKLKSVAGKTDAEKIEVLLSVVSSMIARQNDGYHYFGEDRAKA